MHAARPQPPLLHWLALYVHQGKNFRATGGIFRANSYQVTYWVNWLGVWDAKKDDISVDVEEVSGGTRVGSGDRERREHIPISPWARLPSPRPHPSLGLQRLLMDSGGQPGPGSC